MDRREAIKKTALALGVAMSASSIRSAFGQASEPALTTAGPRFLTQAQFDLVASIADRILPRSDTPGALDVGVAEFVDVTFGKYFPAEESESFLAGMQEMDVQCVAATGSVFAALSAEAQDAQLMEVAKAGGGFYKKLRELTLVGYFTSEKVSKEVLNYLPIPGGFDPCISIEEVGNANWAK